MHFQMPNHGKITILLSLWKPLKAHGEVQVQLHTFSNSTLYGGKQQAIGRFFSGARTLGIH